MTEQYKPYPLTMAHPNFVPSKPIPIPGTEIYNGNGEVIRRDYRGSPQLMPPEVVHNEAEEEYYRAQGYERAGKVDPAAWVSAHSGPKIPDAEFQAYPKWGKDADGNAVLYMTAADDPNADEADMSVLENANTAVESTAVPTAPPSEMDNLRAQMAGMNDTMRQMMETMQEVQAENARLRAQKEAPEADPKPESGDDAVVVSDDAKPRAKRPYVRKEK